MSFCHILADKSMPGSLRSHEAKHLRTNTFFSVCGSWTRLLVLIMFSLACVTDISFSLSLSLRPIFIPHLGLPVVELFSARRSIRGKWSKTFISFFIVDVSHYSGLRRPLTRRHFRPISLGLCWRCFPSISTRDFFPLPEVSSIPLT